MGSEVTKECRSSTTHYGLVHAVETIYSIECHRCTQVSHVNLTWLNSRDTKKAAMHFFNEGWRNTGTCIACPACAKKKDKDR